MGASAAYGKRDNDLPPAFKAMNCVVTNPLDRIGIGPFKPYTVGDPPYEPFPWVPAHPTVPTIPYTPPVPWAPPSTVTSGTNIGGLFPTAKEFRDLSERVERLERRLAETAEPVSEPLRAEDV